MAASGTGARGRWRTRANALTLLRLAAPPPLAVAIATDAYAAAALLFAFAVAMDFADGYAARRFGEASPVGGLVDHGVDAVFVTAGIAALAAGGVLPAALPVLITLAFAQYAFDSRVEAGRPLRGSRIGRWNGIAYYAILAVPVVRDALGLSWPPPAAVLALGWALVATTIVSMLERAWVQARRSRPR